MTGRLISLMKWEETEWRKKVMYERENEHTENEEVE